MPSKQKRPLPPPKPDLEVVYEVDGAPPKLFLIWYGPDGVWWRPNRAGYSKSLFGAGTYSEADARAALAGLGRGDRLVPLEEAVRAELRGANPVVLQAIAAMGGR